MPSEPSRYLIKVNGKVRVNRLLQLEEQLTRSLKGLSSGNSMEPVAPRPPAPVVRSAPRKDASEAKKDDWMLMKPDDFAEQEASLELRKMLKDGGMLKDPKLSRDDQFYRDFNLKDFGTKGIIDAQNDREMGQSQDAQKKDSATPAEVARSEENLRNILQDKDSTGLSSLGGKPTSLSDLFRAPEESPFDRNQDKADSYIDQYRKLMSPPAPTDFASSALGSAALAPMRTTGLQPGLNSLPSGGNNILGPQFGSINPVLTPRSPADTTEQVLNQWNKYYTPPAIEPSRTPTPVKPTFDAPRRKF